MNWNERYSGGLDSVDQAIGRYNRTHNSHDPNNADHHDALAECAANVARWAGISARRGNKSDYSIAKQYSDRKNQHILRARDIRKQPQQEKLF